MLDDIVALPNRLRNYEGREAIVSSLQCVWYPIPTFNKTVGYYEPDDSHVTCIGSDIILPTGKNSWFRYKFIENCMGEVCEFMVYTESPLDVRKPLQSRNVKLYCPCFSATNLKTLVRRTYANWRSVRAMAELQYPMETMPLEAALGEEGNMFGEVYNSPEVKKAFDKYPVCDQDVSELRNRGYDDQLVFRQLISNIDAYKEKLDEHGPYAWFDPALILVGLHLPRNWSHFEPVKPSILEKLFVRGPIPMKDVIPYIGPRFNSHPYSRHIVDELIDPHVEVSTNGEETGMFQILKYAGHLPYSEVGIEIVRNLADNTLVGRATVYNPYDLYTPVPTNVLVRKRQLDKTVEDICSELQKAYPNCDRAQVQRSWTEEAYITIRNTDGSLVRYYFDIVSEILVSQALLRDYSGPNHALGM